MSRIESSLKRLADGCFICEVHYPDEFAVLSDPDSRRRVELWLEEIGYRLVRLSDEGAFFMAHAVVTTEMRTKLRDEMKTVRGRLEPMVGFMQTLRQAQGRNPQIHSGDVLWESEIGEAVRGSPLLERRLSEMRDFSGGRLTDSSLDRVRRMLTYLTAEGYLVETNPTSKGYTVTGKIEYLYQLIGFIAENTSLLSDDEVVDQIDQQMRLDGHEPQVPEAPGPGPA